MDASADRLKRIDELFDAALDLPADQREQFLRVACADDTALYAGVQRLLASAELKTSPLDLPAAAFAAHLIAGAKPQPEPSSQPLPSRIGPYRVVGELGRGGMGTVYLAERDEHFQQRVALKLIRRGLHVDAELVQRFVDERQMLASLEHANIARLLDGGLTDDGLPWYAMELVEGEPLDRWCDARRLSVDARLELFYTVCDAVQYAHERQIIHRDLKPSNILVRADGTVKLLDFGIAKLTDLEGGTVHTHTSTRVMTPQYASPEQIRGETVSAASDVYTLGVVLYELLTGRRPTSGRTTGEVEQAVLTREPARPSTAVRPAQAKDATSRESMATAATAAHARGTTPARLSERLRGELDDIVLKALAKDTKRRYPSAAALAAAVRRYLEGVPVHGVPRMLRRVAIGLVVGAAGLALAFAFSRQFRDDPPASDTPIIAVGLIADYRAAGASETARPIADLLATNLARVPSLRVISAARIYELIARDGAGSNPDAGAYSTAARQAGAAVLVDGALYTLDTGGFRLDLRRTSMATGELLAAHTVVGHDIFALVDSGTLKLTAGVGITTRIGPVADVTTHSEAAYRLYEQGVRAHYRGDHATARDLLDAALAEDSLFAMARYYRGRSEGQSSVRALQHLEKAVQLADQATDRERLNIRAYWAWRTSDPSAVATADSLAARYPQEAEAHLWAGLAMQEAGDLAGSLHRLRRVIELDSAARQGRTPICTVCDARGHMVEVLLTMDSLASALRESHSWTRIEPQSAVAWHRLSDTMAFLGMIDSARIALRRAIQLDARIGADPVRLAYFHFYSGDYETLDRELREHARAAEPERRTEPLWYLTISLRRQGRFIDALEVSRTQRALTVETQPNNVPMQYAYHVAQVLFELGRHRESAALFDSIAQAQAGFTPSMRARYQAWPLTLAANALAAAGDTAPIVARLDTIQTLGAQSLLGRDQRLHHHVRGLLLSARGDNDAAIAEFRRAVTVGIVYTRSNFELARLLLARRRSAEAVKLLQPALHSIEGSALYITRTELEELLARAWDAAGSPDSALVHYRAVAQAWQHADPSLRPRLDAVRARVTALESSLAR